MEPVPQEASQEETAISKDPFFSILPAGRKSSAELHQAMEEGRPYAALTLSGDRTLLVFYSEGDDRAAVITQALEKANSVQPTNDVYRESIELSKGEENG